MDIAILHVPSVLGDRPILVSALYSCQLIITVYNYNTYSTKNKNSLFTVICIQCAYKFLFYKEKLVIKSCTNIYGTCGICTTPDKKG